MKYAIIDVGSNSIRLMLYENGRAVKYLTTTKLGQGLAKSRNIEEENLENSVKTIADYQLFVKKQNIDNLFVFATEAVRCAKNADIFIKRLQGLGITPHILTSDEEAEIGFIGVAKGQAGSIGVIDIGGASTEVCYGNDGKMQYGHSTQIGVRKIFDICNRDKLKMDEYFSGFLSQYKKPLQHTKFYSIGGTATSIASVLLKLEVYDFEKINGYEIQIDKLNKLSDIFFSKTVAEIENIKGMYKPRAEVITQGAYLLLQLMKYFNLQSITVSESDNLEGYIFKYLK